MKMKMPTSPLLLICSALLSSVCLVDASYAQQNPPARSQQAPASAVQAEQVALNLQDVDIKVLIDMVAELTQKNFIVDPRVKANVSVISGGSLNSNQLYDVFLSILEVHNFAAVDSGNVIKIVPSNVIKQQPTPTVFSSNQSSSEPATDKQITQIIQLKHASVRELTPIIRPLIPATSHFAPHNPSNSLIITDTAANIQRVLGIIESIDVPDKRANVRVVYLNTAKASDIANSIQQVVTSTISKSEGGAENTRITVQALDSINALIISAPDSEYLKIKALVDELDIERSLESGVNVIYLKHAKAPDLVSILNDVTQNSVDGKSVDGFSVQADEATNSLVVRASGNQLKTMREVIEKLDLRRAQVFVETIIAEVSLDQAANLGINWGFGDSAEPVSLIDRDDPTKILGSATVGTNFNVQDSGLTYSLLDFKKYKLDVIINALRSDTNSNILSTPTILTLDNEPAEIVVGQEVPFITGRFNSGNNNSQTTDSNGNSVVVNNNNNFQTIERKDVGIKLRIKPQISEGNTIQLEVVQEISSVSNTTIQGQADLITNRRSIEAVVQVDDGQVIVLGGLIQNDIVDTVEWVPILGKIPLIGNLFRSKTKTAVKRNLMVFLKPRIIRSPDELAQFSRSKYNDVRFDSKQAKKQSSKFLIRNAAPEVLDDYDNVINDGNLGSERRNKLREDSINSTLPVDQNMDQPSMNIEKPLSEPKNDDGN